MLRLVLLATLIIGSGPVLAASCRQIMLDAGYNGSEFKMHGRDTIEILANHPGHEYAAYLRHSIKAPQCNIVSMTAQGLNIWDYRLDKAPIIEVKSIKAWSLINYGIIKADNINIAIDSFIKLPKIKQQKIAIPKKIEQTHPEIPVRCGLVGLAKSTIEAKFIDASCTKGTAIENNGQIKANKIKGKSLFNDGIDNGSHSGPAVMIAESIEGIGANHGIYNAENATIQAKWVRGSGLKGPNQDIKVSDGIWNRGEIKADIVQGDGYSKGVDNWSGAKIYANLVEGWGKDQKMGMGVNNAGTITTKVAKCCGSEYNCYGYIGKVGTISTTVENMCPKGEVYGTQKSTKRIVEAVDYFPVEVIKEKQQKNAKTDVVQKNNKTSKHEIQTPKYTAQDIIKLMKLHNDPTNTANVDVQEAEVGALSEGDHVTDEWVGGVKSEDKDGSVEMGNYWVGPPPSSK